VLVGRDEELETLLALARHPPSVAVVEGQAGVGKTRLVTEMATRTRAQGMRVLVGRCQLLAESFPLGPLVSALGGLVEDPPPVCPPSITGALTPLLPELAVHLPPPPPDPRDPEVQRHQRFRAVAALLGSLGPTLCILEDLHWSDEGTGDCLRFLVDELPPELALVLTYRDEDLPASLAGLASRLPAAIRHVRVQLRPLGAAPVAELVQAIVGPCAAGSDLAAAVHRRTAGLPFAVEELLRLADDRAGGAQHLRDRLRAKIVEIDGRISALAQMRASLEAALHAGCDALTRCTDEDCPFWTAPATPAPERPERSHPGSGLLD
jgi:predicted ATPase